MVRHVSACLANVDLPVEQRLLEEAVEARAWGATSAVFNDTYALLRAGLDEPHGIAVICGAGINCTGRRRDGQEVRFAAVGHISGDWGGGGFLWSEAMWWAARAEDGRGPHTALADALPAHFGLPSMLALIEAVHLGHLTPERCVEMTPLLFDVASDGDRIAADVVRRQAAEVAALAVAALTRLELLDQPTPVVLGGGVLTAGHRMLLDGIDEELASVGAEGLHPCRHHSSRGGRGAARPGPRLGAGQLEGAPAREPGAVRGAVMEVVICPTPTPRQSWRRTPSSGCCVATPRPSSAWRRAPAPSVCTTSWPAGSGTGTLTLRRARAFLLDEYVGLPRGHDQSYRSVIHRDLVSRVDLDPAHVLGPDGNATDLDRECAAYEDAIAGAGGVDLQLLGVGTDGHLAFNEPGSSLASRTRIKTLTAGPGRTTRGSSAAIPTRCPGTA